MMQRKKFSGGVGPFGGGNGISNSEANLLPEMQAETHLQGEV
jgi:hypothetical protein